MSEKIKRPKKEKSLDQLIAEYAKYKPKTESERLQKKAFFAPYTMFGYCRIGHNQIFGPK